MAKGKWGGEFWKIAGATQGDRRGVPSATPTPRKPGKAKARQERGLFRDALKAF